MADNKPTEAELAVIAVSRTLFELLIARGLITADDADRLLAVQQQGFEKQKLVAAAGIVGMVRTLLAKKHGSDAEKHQKH